MHNALLLSAVLAAAVVPAAAQTQATAVPVPFVTAAVGVGNASTTVCAASIETTDGSSFGDGCPGTQAKVSAPQGAAVDAYGNVYFADYNDKQVRVLYEGGAQLAAAITAANSGYAISASRRAPAPTPVAGDVYTLAGVGASTSTFTTITATGNACANYAASGQPTGLNSLGDGCPGASAPVAARDVKVDSDGNLFIADYSNGRIRVFCVNCATGTMAQKLIAVENPTVTAPANGAMYTVAGFANGYRDGDIGYNTASNASGATAAQAISLLRDPTGVAISATDDVFIADNLNNALRVLYNGGAVAKAILQAQGTYSSPVVGYVYTIAGAGCVSAATNKTGSVASANSCLTTTGSDTPAAGNTVGTGAVWSVYLDASSNVFYTDAANERVKVIYGGVANPLTITGTLHVGYTYSFAGQGTGVAGAQNGVPPSQVVLGSAQSVGGDAYGDIYFADYSTGYFYKVSSLTGDAVIFAGDGGVATPAAGAVCNGVAAGPTMTDAFYNGCPATQAKFTSPRGPIVADAAGDLYFGDAIGYFVRAFRYGQTFPATAVGASSAAQPYAFTFTAPLTLASRVITPGSDFADGGNSTCTAGAYVQDATCVQYVTFTPSQPSERNGAVELTTASGVAGFVDIGGIGSGAELLVWPGTVTTAASGYTATGVAVDASGAVYLSDTATGKAFKVSGGTATALASGFTTPAGIAVDGAGNVFIADSGANTITEVPVVGGTAFVLSKAVSAPGQVAVGPDGTLYVADTGNNRVLAFAPNAATPRVLAFSGLVSPKAVAVDGAGDVYTASGSSLVELTPAGTQTTRAGVSGIAWLAVDASGTLYASTDGTSVTAFAVDGTSPTVYTGTAVAGVALDGAGGLYVADTGVNGVAKSQGTAGYYKFPATTGSEPIAVLSAGTQAVTSTAFTSTNTTDYNVVASTANGCSGALPSGSSCGYTANYAQVTLGAPTDTLTFAGATTFTLASISLTPAITISALPATLVYGSTVTLSATVYGPANSGGTVTFYANGTKMGTGTSDANGDASYSYTPTVGVYAMTADYTPAGATSASVTTKTSAAVTVTAEMPGLSLQVTPASGYTTTTFTATAPLTVTAGTTPTGTVTFYSGTTVLGTAMVVPLNGGFEALATFSGLAVGTDCITAQYSGDVNFNKATTACTNVTVAAGFSIAATSTALAFQTNYQEAQTFLNITTGGRTDTLSFACTGLPSKLQCAFSPATVTLAGGSATVQVQMLVSNSGATYGAVHDGPMRRGEALTLAAMPLLGAALLLMRRRRMPALLVLLLAMAAAGAVSGCASQDPTTLEQPAGTYNFNVVVSNATSTVQTIPFTLTVP